MSKIGTEVEKVIAEYDPDDGWLVMWPSGDITRHIEAGSVARAVRVRDAKRAREQGSRCNIIVTMIEWRNVPAGFEAPRG